MSNDNERTDDHSDELDDQRGRGSGFPRWLKWGLLGALTILIVVYGAVLIYVNFINDSPDELDESDLDAALAIDGTAPDSESSSDPTTAPTTPQDETVDPTDTAPVDTTPVETIPPSETTEAPPAASGPTAAPGSIWEITTDSELGYRVKEVLFGVDTDGVGRTNQITGAMVVDGTAVVEAEFVVDVATITSDDSRRDGQFRGRIMSTDEFPTAEFTLTEPIEMGVEPADGAEVTATATGELTLRGVTNPVTFEVTARQEGERIGVLGNIPVVFADYSIANPSVPGISTEDNGLLEFVLVFEPAT